MTTQGLFRVLAWLLDHETFVASTSTIEVRLGVELRTNALLSLVHGLVIFELMVKFVLL